MYMYITSSLCTNANGKLNYNGTTLVQLIRKLLCKVLKSLGIRLHIKLFYTEKSDNFKREPSKSSKFPVLMKRSKLSSEFNLHFQ